MKNPLSRFFIKDYTNINHMANKNQVKEENPAAADNQANSTNGAPNERTVIAVDGQGNPVDGGEFSLNEGVTSGEGPNQAEGEVRTQGTPEGGTAGDQLGQGETAPAGSQATDPPQGDINIDQLISESTKEIKSGDEAQEARKKKQELLMRAINSRMYIENIIFKNTETDEQVGTKMRYVKDPYGKTVYDYANDEEITAHLGFKIPDEDPQDGSPIERQITIYWTNPVF